ncbi:hypothetical protein V6N13_114858 [Hibiscus sabdariffa]|uniref:ENTH domain-containing protein n=1 Tax=Hibiscus sabdariffa TaxID=183260 RepID=A0ABR2U332_9ROSI
MAPGKLKKAIGRVKDKTRIGLAKVGGNNSLSDLDVAIVRATTHEEQPADERHFQEIVCITSYSRAHIIACVSTLSKRLNKTKSWTVALKSLMLIQKLLAEGDPVFQQELFFSTRHGTRILNLSDFRDASRNRSWDFSAFVRSYAFYLEERLEYKIQDRRGEKPNQTTTLAQDEEQEQGEEEEEESNDNENADKTSHFGDMKTEELFTTLQHLQQLLERFLGCRPTGEAKCHRVVIGALYQIVKESFQLYYDITEILEIFMNRFTELDLAESLNVRDIFCCQGKQLDKLDKFYSWCKTVNVGQTSEYPEIEKISQEKLDLIDVLVRGKKSAAQQIEDGLPNAEPEAVEEDLSVVKALLAQEEEAREAPVEIEPEKEKEEDYSKAIVVEKEADLLNLGKDAMSSEDQSEKSTVVLFDGSAPAGPPPGSGWEMFEDEADREPALVQSGSNLNHQKANVEGGFDVSKLNGMYQQEQTMKATETNGGGAAATGSASSFTFGSADRLAPPS